MVLLESNYSDEYYTDEDKDDLLYDICSSLNKDRDWSVNAFIDNAKVPLIKAKYIPWNLNCKLTKV